MPRRKTELTRIPCHTRSRREAAMQDGQMQVYLCHIMYMRNMVTRSYLQLPIPRCRRIWTICKRKVISPVDRSVRKQPLGTGWGYKCQMQLFYPHFGTVQMLIAWKRRRQFCRSRADVGKYQKLHKKIQNYIYRTYEIAERLERTAEKDFSQTELCMLLQYDLLQENDREKAQQMLLASVEKNEYRLVTGFVGTGLILRSLTDAGGAQSAYRLLLSEKNPSWLYSVDQGATTIWERPDSYTEESGFSKDEMNSFDHYNNGCAMQWIYESILGIRVDLAGEQPITIAPVLPDETVALTEAAGSYHSIYGEIKVGWKMNDRNIRKEVNKSVDIRKKDNSGNGETVTEAEFTIEIPAGQTALVALPIVGFEPRKLPGGIWKFAGVLEQ